jgi:hypothetical protein
MEGYRLLRHTRDEMTRPAQPSSAARPAWPPAKPAPDAKPPAVMASPAPRASDEVLRAQSHRMFRDLAPEGFWTRLRRSVFGTAKPIFEDRRV